MAPTQGELIKKLTAENADLTSRMNQLIERVSKLETALQSANESCEARHSEACVRVESVEENLCQLSEGQQDLQYDQANIMLRLESQQMYSRKQTLLLTGPAVEPPTTTRGEDVRGTALRLLNRHLGITNLQPSDICACHRLKNPKVILVRFAHLDHSERVYQARTKPKVRGLLVFESLTAERLSVINMIKALKDQGNQCVLSYYTQGGKIFVRTTEDRSVRPVEIPFGLDMSQIKALCEGGRVSPTAVAVCDQFRAVNSGTNQVQRHSSSRNNPWTLVTRGRGPNPVRASTVPHSRESQAAPVRAAAEAPGTPSCTVRAPHGPSPSDRPHSGTAQPILEYGETSVKRVSSSESF